MIGPGSDEKLLFVCIFLLRFDTTNLTNLVRTQEELTDLQKYKVALDLQKAMTPTAQSG